MTSRMKRFVWIRLGCALIVAVALLGAACAPAAEEPIEPPDTRPVDEAAIRGLIQKWDAAAGEKDVEAFTAVYADDAVLMLEGMPDMRGKAAIVEGTTGMMSDPNFALSFEADEVVVARAGDLAYEVGTYSMTMSDENGEPMSQAGSYIVLWEKQADGTWKVLYDVPVSDPPADAD